MKNRILLALATAVLAVTQVQATELPPPVGVPDSGGTVGILTVGLLALVALRRKFSK